MIYLSFDTEEFDVPRDYGVQYDTIKEGMLVSQYGIERILQILDEESIKATFFCTSNFVLNATDVVKKIQREAHEIASHGCDHWKPKADDARQSKRIIEDKLGIRIEGYRQPRMFAVDNKELAHCGYQYNASLNPTHIPGHYSHLRVSRIPWVEDGVVQIPTSVSPYLRIPMFWLSLHHFPVNIYLWMMKRIVNHDNEFNTYFHPWEFYPLNNHPELNIPYFIRRKSGAEMEQRLKQVIAYAKVLGYKFGTYKEYANEIFK
jgi:peptidoglycan/xylan/chitin deacetylase (PgdA/CDA1 family)